MKQAVIHEQIQFIPIDKIAVLNPRVRSRRQHREIVENIRAIGLKRPITVSRRVAPDGTETYDLVCGQGRLEAFQLLNQATIPAFVSDANQEDGFIMSLVENIARKPVRPIDQMREIGSLRDRDYNAVQIANRIGATPAWVNMIIGLLDNGEERLLSAVETGLIPIGMAINISRSSSAEVQTMLADAYERGELRGKRLSTLRRLLDQRVRRSKSLGRIPVGATRKKISPVELRLIYEREAEKQRRFSMNAKLTHDRLIFATLAMKELVGEREFMALLTAEGLEKMPKILVDRMNVGTKR